jgi:hypothetical protein
MLVRIFAILLFDLAAFIARAQSLDQQLVGRWQAEGFHSMEIIFRADHTYIGRSDRYVSTGSWRVHENRLTTVSSSPSSGEQGTDTCRVAIRGDRLFLGLHETTKNSDGRQIGKTEQWMQGLTYKRVR